MRNVTSLRWLYGAVTVVGLGFAVERVQAQDEAPLQASPAPAPDVQEREKMAKPPAPPDRSPEVDELLQKVKLTRADIERKKADKSERALPAATDEAPDVKEMKKLEKAPSPPGRSPDLGELIEKIKKQPGGAEKLEKARKGGAKLPPGGAGGATLESSLERMPGPRMDGPVFSFDSAVEQLPTLKVTRGASFQNVVGLGYLSAGDWSPHYSNAVPMWGPYVRAAYNNSLVGNVDIKPYVAASMNLTNPGWYIVNFVATRGKASLKRYAPTSSPPFVAVTQWDNSASANPYESYPFVVNLAAGYHTFYWIPEAGYFWVSEVSLMKL